MKEKLMMLPAAVIQVAAGAQHPKVQNPQKRGQPLLSLLFPLKR